LALKGAPLDLHKDQAEKHGNSPNGRFPFLKQPGGMGNIFQPIFINLGAGHNRRSKMIREPLQGPVYLFGIPIALHNVERAHVETWRPTGAAGGFQLSTNGDVRRLGGARTPNPWAVPKNPGFPDQERLHGSLEQARGLGCGACVCFLWGAVNSSGVT